MTTYKRLTFAEREEMSRQVAAGYGVRAIARQLGRAPSTMTRELHRARIVSDHAKFTPELSSEIHPPQREEGIG